MNDIHEAIIQEKSSEDINKYNNNNIENNINNSLSLSSISDNEHKIQKYLKIMIVIMGIFIIILLILLLVVIFYLIFLNKDPIDSEDYNDSKDSKDSNENEDIFDDPIILKNEIFDEYETKKGAHYFAYSPYSTEYSEVKGLIKLPDSINTNYGKRNAYISFGIRGFNDSLNVGLINGGGGGWTPFYYFHKSEKMFCYHNYTSNEETYFIEIKIEVTQKRQLLAYFAFKNSTLYIINTLKFEIDVSDFIEYERSKVKLRFFRFASLVPKEKDDQNDGTFVNNGKFSELSIVKNNKTESWGISGNNIEASWKISSKRIQVDFKKSIEKFSIFHRKNPF